MDFRRVMVIVYEDMNGAARRLEQLKRMQGEDILDIEGAAVIRKEMDGSVHVDDKNDVGAGSGTMVGAIVGGLIGLMAGPGGAIVGAAAGAATGGVSAALIDLGIDRDVVESIKKKLAPGSSALVAIIDDELVEPFEDVMGDDIRAGAAPYYYDVDNDVYDQWNRRLPR